MIISYLRSVSCFAHDVFILFFILIFYFIVDYNLYIKIICLMTVSFVNHTKKC